MNVARTTVVGSCWFSCCRSPMDSIHNNLELFSVSLLCLTTRTEENESEMKEPGGKIKVRSCFP